MTVSGRTCIRNIVIFLLVVFIAPAERKNRVTLTAAKLSLCKICSNRIQPSRKFGNRLVQFLLSIHSDECFLNNIIGLIVIAKIPKHIVHKLILVSSDKEVERFRLPLLKCRNEFFIGLQ